MKKLYIYLDYFKRTAFVWVLFIVCVYCVIACEFESIRIKWLSIDKDEAFVNKLNGIIENLSSSYIAGVIFFFLSDTLPFIRRKKVAYRNVEKSLELMLDAIDMFSEEVNGQKWDEKTDVTLLFEDVSGGEYSIDIPSMKLPRHLFPVFAKLVNNLNSCIDFVVSQELYINIDLVNALEKIKFNNNYQFINSICNTDEERYIKAKDLVDAFGYIIVIKTTISNYL